MSPEEKETLDAYRILAKGRDAGLNPLFWLLEFEQLQHFMMRTARVIDIGCGTARDAHLFLSGGYQYIGIDASPEMLAEAAHLNPNGTFARMDMHMLAFENHVFDAFWAAASLIHVPKYTIDDVLQELRRITKIGGAGFIAIKGGKGQGFVSGSTPGDQRFFAYYGLTEFQDILRKNKFLVLSQSVCADCQPNTLWLTYLVRTLP